MYIHLVHVLLSACLSQTGLALELINFNFFFNKLLDEDLENIATVWAKKPRGITNQLYIITNTYLFYCFCV